VKRLVQILLVALVVFMVLAVAQEWRFFASAWFGAGEQAPAKLTETDRRAAADTVATLLSLMGHFYASGGDPRFAERMPASAGLIDELRSDVDYVARNHRIEEPELERLVVLSVEPSGPSGAPGASAGIDRAEVRTLERWRFRIHWAADGTPAEADRVRTVHGRYYLVRSSGAWRVEGWQPIADEEGES